ncbi:MAG: acyl-CoA thioesterase [Dermatophilaceae bacterium]
MSGETLTTRLRSRALTPPGGATLTLGCAVVTTPARVHHGRYQLRVEDLNPSGHMDNLCILRAVDEVRHVLLGMRGPSGVSVVAGMLDAAGPEITQLVARHQVDYLRELHYHPSEPLDVTMWVCRVGTSSFDLAAEVRQDTDSPVAARVMSTTVLIDVVAGAPWPMSEAVRADVTAYLGQEPAFRSG